MYMTSDPNRLYRLIVVSPSCPVLIIIVSVLVIFCKLLTNTVRILSGTSLFYVLGHLSPISFTPSNNQNLHVSSLSMIDSLLAEVESICRGQAGTWQVQTMPCPHRAEAKYPSPQ